MIIQQLITCQKFMFYGERKFQKLTMNKLDVKVRTLRVYDKGKVERKDI